MNPLTNAQNRAFKAQAQGMKATLKIGRDGINTQFLAALDAALKENELVKVKFDQFKELIGGRAMNTASPFGETCKETVSQGGGAYISLCGGDERSEPESPIEFFARRSARRGKSNNPTERGMSNQYGNQSAGN